MQENIDKISPIKQRILQFVEYKRITKAEFLRNTGMSYENFKGKSLISDLGSNKIGEILLVYPELSSRWLLTGNGEMINGDLLKGVNQLQKNEVNELQALYNCQNCKEKDKEIEQLKVIIQHYEKLLGFKNPDESKKSKLRIIYRNEKCSIN